MARKDVRLMQAEAERAGLGLAMLPGLAALMDEMLGRGLGEADWTVIAKDLVEGRE